MHDGSFKLFYYTLLDTSISLFDVIPTQQIWFTGGSTQSTVRNNSLKILRSFYHDSPWSS